MGLAGRLLSGLWMRMRMFEECLFWSILVILWLPQRMLVVWHRERSREPFLTALVHVGRRADSATARADRAGEAAFILARCDARP